MDSVTPGALPIICVGAFIAALCLFTIRAADASVGTSQSGDESPSPAAASPIAEILTPEPRPEPRVNGPAVFGVRPGSQFLYSIPATGDRPMTFAVDNLPDGLSLDPLTGRIAGTLTKAGTYKVNLRAKNALGAAEKPFRIVVGSDIALTPCLGWNSWNCWGTGVSQDKVLRSARAMVAAGLDRHGWTYINIDDGWQGARGGPLNALQPDPKKFTDMKAVCDQIHALGLKTGIYSTPWTLSYGGRTGGSSVNADGSPDPNADHKAAKNHRVLPFAIGKYSFTKQDAQQFADWGIDYLKYDWGPVEDPETEEMAEALQATHRDIVLSLSNNHVGNLFREIPAVSKHAQSWRTTTDITDNWHRVAYDIGFSQDKWALYAKPGHFNDADMLVVGHVFGWSGNPRPTRLTRDQQYAHISLWCLLSSPLLIGCDLEQLDPFTLGLLRNDEVLEIDQDALCRQATLVSGTDTSKVYAKPLEDGSLAVGLFNLGSVTDTVAVHWADLKITGEQRVRDLWRQKDIGLSEDKFECPVAPDGVVLIRIFPSN